MGAPGSYAAALAITLLVEAAVTLRLAPVASRNQVIAALLCANLVSHPLAWSLPSTSLGSWVLLEVSVAVLEGVLLRLATGLPARRAALVAGVANGVTASLALSPLRGLGFWS